MSDPHMGNPDETYSEFIKGAKTYYVLHTVEGILNAKKAEISAPPVNRHVQFNTPIEDVSEVLKTCLSDLNTQLEICSFIIEESVDSSLTLSMIIDEGFKVSVCEIIYKETSRDSDVGEGATEIPTNTTLDFVPFTTSFLRELNPYDVEMDTLVSQHVYNIADRIASLVSQSINGPTMEG